MLIAQSSYTSEVGTYRAQRAANIGAETGWAALTDLRWLDAKGQFTIGRAASNAIALEAPSAPPRLGVLTVSDRAVTLRVAPGVEARVKGQRVADVPLTADVAAADAVKIGGLTLGLIERSDRRALRVWDRLAPGRQNFKGLRWYPIDERWRVNARFIAHQPAPIMRVQNIVGQTVEMKNPGAAAFTVGGREHRLEALLEADDADELFFMFRDATSGNATYAAGRYLYTPLPANGRVTLDFNRAINPPCAFTDFATCPLPPPGNRLAIAIEAGEMEYKR